MTELLELDGDDQVLEIGTGSGYQAAVLAEIARAGLHHRDRRAARRASRALDSPSSATRTCRSAPATATAGWPEHAPFDAIILTAAPPEIPQPLIDQLAVGGVLVAPVGGGQYQELVVIERTANGHRPQVGGSRCDSCR